MTGILLSCQQTPLTSNQVPKVQTPDDFKIQSNSPLPTFKQNELPKTPRYVVKFVSKDASLDDEVDLPDSGNVLAKGKILMPKQGEFNVNFSAGTAFQITDNDATDGTAAVQMPQGQLDVFLRLKGQPSEQGKQRELIFEDVTAGINETLKRTKKDKSEEKFYGLGTRSFTSSTSFTWKLTNDKVKNMTTRWYTTDTPTPTPTPPPSNEVTVSIGTSGGLVELAGVGSLTIPAGALSQTTAITMRKETNPSPPSSDHTTVSPVVTFEPNGLQFNVPAILKLNIDTAIVGANHPSLVQYVVRDGSGNAEILKESGFPENATLNRGVLLSHFSTASAEILTIIADPKYTLDSLCRTHASFATRVPSSNLWTSTGATNELNTLCVPPAAGDDGHYIVYYSTTTPTDDPFTPNDIEGAKPTDDSQVVAVLLGAEKAHEAFNNNMSPVFSGYTGPVAPALWFYSPPSPSSGDIPILILPTDTLSQTQFQLADGLIHSPGTDTILPPQSYLAVDSRKNILTHPKLEETVYHEVFHLFQTMNLAAADFGSIYPKNPIAAPFSTTLLESTANRMAAKQLYTDWAQWNFGLTLTDRDISIWTVGNTRFLDGLRINIQDPNGGGLNFLANSLYSIYSSTGQTGFMSYLANTLGDDILLQLPLYFTQNHSSTSDFIESISNFLTSQHSKSYSEMVYPDYAAHVLLKDRYGFIPQGDDSKTQTITDLNPIVAQPPTTPPVGAVVEDFANITAFNGATADGGPIPLGNHMTELDSTEMRFHKLRCSNSTFSGIIPGVVSNPEIVIFLDTVLKTSENGTAVSPTMDQALFEQVAKASRVMLLGTNGQLIGLPATNIKPFVEQSTRLGLKYAAKITGFDVFIVDKFAIFVPNPTFTAAGRKGFTYNFKVYVSGTRCLPFSSCEPIF